MATIKILINSDGTGEFILPDDFPLGEKGNAILKALEAKGIRLKQRTSEFNFSFLCG